jgi:hypothetical protein
MNQQDELNAIRDQAILDSQRAYAISATNSTLTEAGFTGLTFDGDHYIAEIETGSLHISIDAFQDALDFACRWQEKYEDASPIGAFLEVNYFICLATSDRSSGVWIEEKRS